MVVTPASGSLGGVPTFTLTAGGTTNRFRMLPASFHSNSLVLTSTNLLCDNRGVVETGNEFLVGTGLQSDQILLTPTAALRAGCPYTLRVEDNFLSNIYFLSTEGNPQVFNYTVETTAPTILSITPVPGATEVSATTSVVAQLSESITPASVNAGSFTVSTGGIPLVGTYQVTGDTATFTPSAPLQGGKTYTVALLTTITDLAGNPLNIAGSPTTFTVEATRPTVLAITPEDATDDVALDSAIVLSFSEAMNTDTLVASTTGVPGSVRLSYQDACLDEREVYTCLTLSEDLRQLTVIPVPPELLPGDADLDVSVDAATVSDLAGNLLDLPFHATFTTRSGAPRLSCSVPEDGDESVDPSAVITMRFSEPIDQSADFSALFALWESDEGTEVSGTFSFPDASTVLFDPSGDLTAGTCYEFLLEPGYTDLDDQSADRVERGSFSTLP